MNNEIKMSDVFKLPLHFNIEICEINKFGCAVEAVAVNKDHILHAINTHDQHLARIAELESKETIEDNASEIIRELEFTSEIVGVSYDELMEAMPHLKQLLEQSK